MAILKFKGLAEYELRLSRLEKGVEKIAGAAIYDGASIVADEIRKGNDRMPERTGRTKQGLQDGFGISPMENDDGYLNVKLGFDGYNTNNVANVLMARVFESGTSKVQKHPFVRPAVNRAHKRCEAKMSETLDKEIKKIMD